MALRKSGWPLSDRDVARKCPSTKTRLHGCAIQSGMWWIFSPVLMSYTVAASCSWAHTTSTASFAPSISLMWNRSGRGDYGCEKWNLKAFDLTGQVSNNKVNTNNVESSKRWKLNFLFRSNWTLEGVSKSHMRHGAWPSPSWASTNRTYLAVFKSYLPS